MQVRAYAPALGCKLLLQKETLHAIPTDDRSYNMSVGPAACNLLQCHLNCCAAELLPKAVLQYDQQQLQSRQQCL